MKITSYLKNTYFWIRVSIVVLILIFAIVLFFVGKQHQFLLDNNTKEINGKTYSSLSLVEAQIDKNEVLELPRRTRLDTYATGQKHTLTVTYNKNGSEVTKSVKFKVPVGEDITLISIPAFVSDVEDELWREEFIQVVQASDTAEESATDDMAMDLAF